MRQKPKAFFNRVSFVGVIKNAQDAIETGNTECRHGPTSYPTDGFNPPLSKLRNSDSCAQRDRIEDV